MFNFSQTKMRKNRNADVVTSSHHESEEEHEQSVDDSEEDWKPEKVSCPKATGTHFLT